MSDQACGVERLTRRQRLLRECNPRQIENRLFDLLGDRTMGGSSVPTSWAHGTWRYGAPGVPADLSARFCDDAAFVGFWSPGSEQMALMARVPCVDGFVRWYCWQRLVAQWCGLRPRLWYWLLRRRVIRGRGRVTPYPRG